MTTSSKLRQSHQRKFGCQHGNKAITFHFIREKLLCKFIFLKYVRTDINITDVLTKPTTKEKLAFCTFQMGLTILNP